jgi:hypothetical protein
VIFNEKAIIAKKSCNPSMQELGAYFKAYESRDNTIGQGSHGVTQVLFCRGTNSMSTGSTLLSSTDGVGMPKMGRVSAWQWAKPNRERRSTC